MHRFLFFAIAAALAGLSPAATAQMHGGSADALATTQLPRTVRPTHYDVAVVPHADAMTFDGEVSIDIEVLQPTSAIVLNAVDMTFSSVRLSQAGGAVFAAPKVAVDETSQTATFAFAKPLVAGQYTLSMVYTGKIGTQPNGLFAIDYDTAAGRKRALYTQFENSDARRFIPSWDEPAYKATFDLEATVPAAQLAVSNMPVAARTPAGQNLERLRFASTPKMSTYLLFFGVGDFERVTAQADGTQVGVVMQKGVASQAAFALESSRIVLHEYNDYFDVPYPLPKLDNVASPGRSQFFGAMENWGAIYTFEYTLLLDPSISTQSDKQSVFAVAAHEIAHMWFGDLVTMRWWDDLWLNEGFASWMAARTTAKLHPEWNTALKAVETRESAMSRDAVATTHPVVQHVETVEQASQAFDAITYSKGSAVIGMLEGYVGAEHWRTGVRQYIKAHAYGNTQSDDLWREIESAAGAPVTAIAHDFTLQPGVPMIRVAASDCRDGKTMLRLRQEEFTKDRPDKSPLSWRVPVIAQTLRGSPSRTLVTDGEATLAVPGCGPVIVNAGQSGYYRTLYAPAQFAAIRDAFATVPAIDQLGLMNDAWSLGMVGLQPASDYLDLANAAPGNADPQLWGDIATRLKSLDDYYAKDPAGGAAMRAFAIAKLSPVLTRVGWEARSGESDPTIVLREQLIGTLGGLGDPDVIAEARRRFAAQKNDPAAVPAALRKTILGIVAEHADAATWEQLHAMAQSEKTALVKDELYSLLASSEDPVLAQRALDLALTDEPGATNSPNMIARVSGVHPDMAFDFAVAHRGQIDKSLDTTSTSRFYPGLGDNSLDPAMIGKIQTYADAHVAAGSRRAAETAIANIRYRMKVRDERLPAIDAWLKRHET